MILTIFGELWSLVFYICVIYTMAETWIQCIRRVHNQNRKTNKNYTWKNAMKDAQKYYKKGNCDVIDTPTEKKNNMRKSKSRRTRKSKH